MLTFFFCNFDNSFHQCPADALSLIHIQMCIRDSCRSYLIQEEKMKMRRLKLVALVMTLAMVISTASAFACTGAYVGKDVSEDGTTIDVYKRQEPMHFDGYCLHQIFLSHSRFLAVSCQFPNSNPTCAAVCCCHVNTQAYKSTSSPAISCKNSRSKLAVVTTSTFLPNASKKMCIRDRSGNIK